MSSNWMNAKKYLGFGSYDFSNSGYVLIFQSFLFPVFFTEQLHIWFKSPEIAWGMVVSISTVIAILFAPRVGAFGDRLSRSLIFGTCVTIVGIVAVLVSLGNFIGPIVVLLGFLLFNAVFEISQSLYDSFLKDLAKDETETVRLSSFAWGFGYLGGALFAGLYFLFDHLQFEINHMLTFFAIAYLVLSIPAVLFFRKQDNRQTIYSESRIGIINLIILFIKLRTESPISFRKLVIYWLVVDAVSGVMYFAPLYLINEINLSKTTVGGLLLIAQIAAAPITYFVGLAANRWGLVLTIRITLVGWIAALIGIFMATSLGGVIFSMVPMVFVIGSTQALLRAHYSMHVPISKAGEGFGYYAIAQKSAAVITPLLISAIILVTGNIRSAFAFLAIIIFIAAWVSAYLPGLPSQVNEEPSV